MRVRPAARICYTARMIRFLTMAVAAVLFAGPAAADAARLSDMQGRWVCTPENKTWPQLLIDHEEAVYRRCDQNTCVTYPITGIQMDGERVTVGFAPGSALHTLDQGGAYRETMQVAETRLETSGNCAFRGTDDIYPPESVRNGK